MATDLCLPVLKYSHATGVRSDNTIAWTHLQAADLFTIVKGKSRAYADEDLNLRVIHGTAVLASVEISAYINAASDARRGAQQHGVTPQVDQLPIFGITKESLLALRYKLNDGIARRMQLRFESPTHCRQVVDAFIRRGMDFQQQRPTTARSGPGDHADRPLTMSSSSPFVASGRPTTSQSNFRPPTALDILPRLPTSRPEIDRQPHHDLELPPPPLLVRDEAAAPRKVAADRPTTAMFYRSTTTSSQQLIDRAAEISRKPSNLNHERPSFRSHAPTLDATPQFATVELTPGPMIDTSPSLTTTSHMPQSYSSSISEPIPTARSSDLAVPSPPNTRPSTSSTSLPPENYDHEIPPRRELPFKVPEGRPSGRLQSLSRPHSSAMTLPPLPKPKLTKEESAALARPYSSSSVKQMHDYRPSTTSPLKRPAAAVEEKSVRPQIMLRPAAKSPEAPIPAPQEARPFQVSRMDDLLASRKPLTERSANAQIGRTDSLADAPHEVVGSPQASPVKSAATVLSHVEHAANQPSLLQTDDRESAGSLEEYATLSMQDRQAVLEDFMMANLENPAFTKLCEDVENCWRRIALGL
ncbi:hypothetical protein BAUCODRAFT_144989 [Baudoinia panamericana UAMH 10762]|uniref:Uncharacterized protein n=1 Tax=Baudoinia panamericana (strain UAMH 10762) TaxID=717646 RepID=M2NKE7_BAUPA|nr:uncharacterized protein BAUCODRAFT_144989 [Baudoinia panamericana UAMH 10762]EMC99590.1 hypothetical protein BAUCODRAFT_144989 [Baudoinia panamericana UAMH 10762]